jgi:hypothetical protein
MVISTKKVRIKISPSLTLSNGVKEGILSRLIYEANNMQNTENETKIKENYRTHLYRWRNPKKKILTKILLKELHMMTK